MRFRLRHALRTSYSVGEGKSPPVFHPARFSIFLPSSLSISEPQTFFCVETPRILAKNRLQLWSKIKRHVRFNYLLCTSCQLPTSNKQSCSCPCDDCNVWTSLQQNRIRMPASGYYVITATTVISRHCNENKYTWRVDALLGNILSSRRSVFKTRSIIIPSSTHIAA